MKNTYEPVRFEPNHGSVLLEGETNQFEPSAVIIPHVVLLEISKIIINLITCFSGTCISPIISCTTVTHHFLKSNFFIDLLPISSIASANSAKQSKIVFINNLQNYILIFESDMKKEETNC